MGTGWAVWAKLLSSWLIQFKFQRAGWKKGLQSQREQSPAGALAILWAGLAQEGKTESCLFLLFLALVVWLYCRNHEGKRLYLAPGESEKAEKNPGKCKAVHRGECSFKPTRLSQHFGWVQSTKCLLLPFCSLIFQGYPLGASPAGNQQERNSGKYSST